MLKTYKTLSLLLDYPDDRLLAAFPSIREEVAAENLLFFSLREELDAFLEACTALPLGEWQMLYVRQFDCSKTVNLYLFEPDAWRYIADADMVYKLHIINGFLIFILFPYTKLMHMVAVPFRYLFKVG